MNRGIGKKVKIFVRQVRLRKATRTRLIVK